MDSKELKKILKPLIKECIKEVVFEEGFLSKIISETIKGTSGVQVISSNEIVKESKTSSPANQAQKELLNEYKQNMKKELTEQREKLSKLTGINSKIFNDIEPVQVGPPSQTIATQAKNPVSQYGALRNIDPNDKGIALDGFMALAGGKDAWKKMFKKKEKEE